MDKRVKKLLKEMTLEEKVGQLTQVFSDIILNYEQNHEQRAEMNLAGERVFKIGSLSGLGDPKMMIKAQDLALENSRLKIPLLNMMDVIHGFKSNYQIALGLGCAFDPKMAYDLSRISAYESAVNGVTVSYTPMADMTNDPRWGRFMEIPSEDTLVSKDYVDAIVRGFQNNLDISKGDVAACVKHFAGYGLAQGGRDYGSADASKQQLYEKYYQAYKSGIDAGSKLVMTAFNTLNGIACTGHYELLRTVLRNEFGFEGVIISDHSSILELVNHGLAKDAKDAARIAIMSGVDIELATTCYSQYLEDLVLEGTVDIKYVDESVARVLTLKYELGLFDNPYGAIDEQEAQNLAYCQEHNNLYKKASVDSFVLLKNENNVLPLSSGSKIGYIGTHFDNTDVLGFNACAGTMDQVVTIKSYLESQNYEFDGIQISDYTALTPDEIKNSEKLIKNNQTIVFPIGEASRWSGEGVSRSDISIPKSQIELLKMAKNAHKKVISIIFCGRPLDLTEVQKYSDSILLVWFPGHMTGPSVIDALYGSVVLSGKLSCSFPTNVGQIPVMYNALPTGRQKQFLEQEYVNGYRDISNDPLYEFGFGLSYTNFEYGKIQQLEELKFSVEVKNTGSRDGIEIVQLYIRDLIADVSRPIKELKSYKKVAIKASEIKVVEFSLTHDDLKYYNDKLNYKYDPGEFEIYIGETSSTKNMIKITVN